VDALNAWREFLALTRKPPWQATAADVEAYAQTLKKRKLRPGTISHRLTRLTKFYEYCQAHRTDPQCPADFNPVAGVSRPRRLKLEKARYLTRSEEAALLDAIRRDPSPLGQRDYALFLLLLRTGWKAGDVRQLKWEDLSWGAAAESAAGEQAGGEGECRRKETLTEEVREAIREYLEASGRMARMLPGDYLFAPSRQALVREAGDRAEDWDAGRPISAGDLLYLLKLHAQRAGLTAARITCHTLRHTAVMRQVEAGASPEAVADMLGVERLDSVKDYLERLAGKPKGRLRARKRLDPATGELVPPGSQDIPSRGPCRAGPRNHLGLKHGFYARYLPEFEWLAEDGNEPQGMDRAIMRWRIVMRRILIVGDGVDNLKDAMRYLKLTGLASHRLCKALKFQQQMRDLQVQLQWAAFFEVRRRK
jgi:integrase/recombinase XerD